MAKPRAFRLAVLGLLLPLPIANAYASPAGTTVDNTAQLSFEADGAVQTVSSNTVRTILAERLDVTVIADAPTAKALGTGETAVGFRIASGGNGAETFILAAGAKGDGASVLRIATDENGNGAYDPGIDPQLNSQQLPLEAGGEAHVFVIVGGVRTDADIWLTASAATGSGAQGIIFPGGGDNGGDAVVGATGATATAHTLFGAGAGATGLFKSQIVTAPDGSGRAVAGATITYSLEARFAEPASAVEVTDAIPAGTEYVAGSLMLDAAKLSEGADTDAGRFDGAAIHVSLGDIAGPAIRTIQFKVLIK